MQWIAFSVFLIFLPNTQCGTYPARVVKQLIDESLKDVSPETQKLLALQVRQNIIDKIHQRQDEEEEEEGSSRPQIFPAIVKIVGSTLTGNATGLVESSASLLPTSVQGFVTGALNAFVNAVNPPKTTTEAPTKAPPKVRATSPKNSPKDTTVPTEPPETTVASTRRTTDEDEEYDSEESTTPSELRSNSTRTNSTGSSPPGRVNGTDGLLSNNNSSAISELLLQGHLDSDNKANWLSLVLNNSELQQQSNNFPLGEIDADNKANWISLLTKPTAQASPSSSKNPPKITPQLSIEPSSGLKTEEEASQRVKSKDPVKMSVLGQMLSSLLTEKKPDLMKTSPELATILKFQSLIRDSMKALVEEVNEKAAPSAPVIQGLYPGGASKVNYASGYNYKASTPPKIALTSSAPLIVSSTVGITTEIPEEKGPQPPPPPPEFFTTEPPETTTEEDEDEDEDNRV